ncbi:MAG: hypothetical protein IJL98_02500 [Lachnospiraceae bacterium]|nr:hypothetical protein [Lachnospiraceae bacterium]
MAERMLVTQALDERDLLVKKITDKIAKASFVDTVKPNEDKVYENRISREEFAEQAKSAFQQINDLIDRYQRIDAAIVASNAATKITTSYGEFTVAGAISLRSRLRGDKPGSSDTAFEDCLQRKIQADLSKKLQLAELKNRQLQDTAETMRLSILGKDSKAKDDKPLEVVTAYVRENSTELVDPLDAQKTIDRLKEKQVTLLSELDTQIKVSNATTFVEF